MREYKVCTHRPSLHEMSVILKWTVQARQAGTHRGLISRIQSCQVFRPKLSDPGPRAVTQTAVEG